MYYSSNAERDFLMLVKGKMVQHEYIVNMDAIKYVLTLCILAKISADHILKCFS